MQALFLVVHGRELLLPLQRSPSFGPGTNWVVVVGTVTVGAAVVLTVVVVVAGLVLTVVVVGAGMGLTVLVVGAGLVLTVVVVGAGVVFAAVVVSSLATQFDPFLKKPFLHLHM